VLRDGGVVPLDADRRWSDGALNARATHRVPPGCCGPGHEAAQC